MTFDADQARSEYSRKLGMLCDDDPPSTDVGDKSLRIALNADRSPYGRRDYLEPSLELRALSQNFRRQHPYLKSNHK